MNKITSKIKLLALFTVVLVLAVFTVLFQGNAQADDVKLNVKIKYDNTVIYEVDKTTYIANSNQGRFKMNYVIKNVTKKTLRIRAVKISETLYDGTYSDADMVYSDSIVTLSAGEEYELGGSEFKYASSDEYLFSYNVYAVILDEEDPSMSFTEDDYVQVASAQIPIIQEKVAFNIDYEYYTTQGIVYPDDRITFLFTIESLSNVPINNIKVYDSRYGLLGEIKELRPRESKNVSFDVTVTESSKSYPHIEYQKPNVPDKIVEEKYEDKVIDIEVVNYNYSLNMEITSDVKYINKNQSVEVTFTIVNKGTCALENISVLDENNVTVFNVDRIEASDSYSSTVTMVFNPDKEYIYTCVSPLTESVTAGISFISHPSIEFNFKLDRLPEDYAYGDTIEVEYVISNKGSQRADNIIMTDLGTGEKWNIGSIDVGEEKIIKYSLVITKEETVFEPSLTGNYANEEKDEISKKLLPKVVTVKMPDRFVDIELLVQFSPKIIKDGDSVLMNVDVKNIGNGDLRSYTLTFIEKNMVIASEGKLEAGASKAFDTNFICELEQKITIKLVGKNSDTGTAYEKTFEVPIVVLPNDDPPVPPETPSITPPDKTPGNTDTPGHQGDDDKPLILLFALGIFAAVLLIVTLFLLIKAIVLRLRK